jgi:RHS repeat-associated protein
LTGADNTTQADEAYSYDANGNRTSGGSVTGANNQLMSDGTYTYTYDGEGNRTKRTEIATGKVTEYVWDYRNRLTSVLFKDAGGVVTKTIDYIYDGNNQRIGKRIDGAVTERYVIDRNQIAVVFDGAGSQTHRYLYGTQVDQVLADETATSMVWALADREGTVSDLVDNSGVVVNHITYDSFGKVVAQSNASVGFRYGYTGREQDAETGLDYYRARYYDAANGRFISEDPLGFGAGDGNLTRYVGNNPVNFTDPSGKLNAELILLKSLSHPEKMNGNKPGTIWAYNYVASNYAIAFATATYWFYIITERESRVHGKIDATSGVPWVAVGLKIKNNPGKVVLRPWGASPESQKKLEPKLEFQRDDNKQYAWPPGTKISEIIFHRLDDKEPKDIKCPDLHPFIEPPNIFNPPQPIPTSRPDTSPSPSSSDEQFNPFKYIIPLFEPLYKTY